MKKARWLKTWVSVLLIVLTVLPSIPSSSGTVRAEQAQTTNSSVPTFLSGPIPLPVVASQDVMSVADALIAQLGPVLGIQNADVELTLEEASQDELGHERVQYRQVYGDVPVYNGQVRVHLDRQQGIATAVTSSFVPNLRLATVMPGVTAEEAIGTAQAILPSGTLVGPPELVVFAGLNGARSAEDARLVYLLDLRSSDPPAWNRYFVDANSGLVVTILEQLQHFPRLSGGASLAPREATQATTPEDAVEIAAPNIIGGEEAQPGAWPWMAALIFSATQSQFCGGTLIYPGWVLTAAHCFYQQTSGEFLFGDLRKPVGLEVVLGRHRLSGGGGETLAVQEIIIPSAYNKESIDYDIALIRLAASSRQEPIPGLVSAEQSGALAAKQPAMALGWGRTNPDGQGSDVLMQVKLPMGDQTICQSLYSGFSNNMLCAGDIQTGGKNTCQGDSGGPLLVSVANNQWVQAGVTSHYYGALGAKCAASGVVTVYSNIVTLGQWVNDQLTQVCNDVTQIPQAQCKALAHLYHATDGPNWKSAQNWLATNQPCAWEGVTCQNNQVVEINLVDKGLHGKLPSQVGDLNSLTRLNLSRNQLKGVMPASLGRLAQLRILELGNNEFEGPIPPEIGNLARLEVLTLSYNRLSDGIPHSVGRLSALKHLHLNQNVLNGSIPDPLGNLTNLEVLNLNTNALSGVIPPTLSKLRRLVFLGLEHNRLEGALPSEIGQLTNLTYLNVAQNQLGGLLPSSLGNLARLVQLRVHENQFSGPLPAQLTKVSLESFVYSQTNVCEPTDNAMQKWLAAIPYRTGSNVACPAIADIKVLATYSANNGRQLPGELRRIDYGPEVGDTDVDNAHHYALAAYDYFRTVHQRESFDGRGAVIISTAHYGKNYLNAGWTGAQIIYGDGFAVKDVVVHEVAHAVTQYTANLEYHWQSGALNESFSDIFAAMVDRDNWLIGEELPAEFLGGRAALRDMEDPARFGQPGHTRDWVKTCSDNEGVHINSGIFNKAYYNVATAIGKEKAERVYYRALAVYLNSTSSFKDARAAVLVAAKDLYGNDSAETRAVGSGMDLVGLSSTWSPPRNDCSCAASTTIGRGEPPETGALSPLAMLITLYQVRDVVLSTAEIGQHYSGLYYANSGAINRLLLVDASLRNQGFRLLQRFMPGLSNLVRGDGVQAEISMEMVRDVRVFLEELSAQADRHGSAEVSLVIQREMARIHWEMLAGASFADGWAYLQSLSADDDGSNRLYTPVIQR